MMDRTALGRLIPHAGDMCLLEAVEEWTGDWIRCRTACHRWVRNPLRREGRLDAIHALEIGAQAVAVHGSLVGAGEAGASPALKYLAGIRELSLVSAPLDRIPEDLFITAACLGIQGESGMYRLQVSAGEREILSARITVVGNDRGQP